MNKEKKQQRKKLTKTTNKMKSMCLFISSID